MRPIAQPCWLALSHDLPYTSRSLAGLALLLGPAIVRRGFEREGTAGAAAFGVALTGDQRISDAGRRVLPGNARARTRNFERVAEAPPIALIQFPTDPGADQGAGRDTDNSTDGAVVW